MNGTGHLVGSPIHEPVLQRQLYLVRSAAARRTAALRGTEDCRRRVVSDLVGRGIWPEKVPTEPEALAMHCAAFLLGEASTGR
jgi:hypothetical protein